MKQDSIASGNGEQLLEIFYENIISALAHISVCIKACENEGEPSDLYDLNIVLTDVKKNLGTILDLFDPLTELLEKVE